jgi:hypothetical protein
MLDEHVEFLERALVEQKLDALPRGQLAAGVLRLDALLAAAELGTGAPFLKDIQYLFHLCIPAKFAWVLTRHFAGGKRPPGIRHRSRPHGTAAWSKLTALQPLVLFAINAIAAQ